MTSPVPHTDVIECVEHATAQEFVDYLLPNRAHWGSGLECTWLFRGHHDADSWELKPFAWRPNGQAILRTLIDRYTHDVSTRLDQLRSQFSNTRCGSWPTDRLQTIIVQRAAEEEAVHQFAQLTDELGLHLPIDDEPPMSGEEYLKHKPAGYFCPSFVHGFAQHHRVPTRLLDWTRKSLYAALFASEPHKCSSSDRIAVWALDRSHVDASEVLSDQLGVFTCPRWRHSFLHAQDGLFTWFRHADRYYADHDCWPTIDALLGAYPVVATSKPLRKITLPKSELDALLKVLWRFRISKAHLMPSYDNVATTVKDRWMIDEF